MSAASCETHGGHGKLELFRVSLDSLALRGDTEVLDTWASSPAGFGFVEVGGSRDDRVYLFAANDGRLRRGAWTEGRISWENESVALEPGFTSFALTHDGEQGVDLALFFDAHRGYAEAWRVSGEPERLWSQARPEWRGLEELTWRDEAGARSRALAFAPGGGYQESVSLDDAGSETFKMNPAARRRFARVGRHLFGLAHSVELSGAAAPTRLELSLFDAQLYRTKTIWSVHEGESWDRIELIGQPGDAEHDGKVWLFRYQARDGRALISSFGAGGLLREQELDLPYSLTDFELSIVDDELRIIAVDEEGVLSLRAGRIDAMVQHLRRGLEDRPGYEFVLMQSGHVLHAEAGGWAELPSPAAPLGRPMTVDTRLNVASISKLITAVTVLRLRDAGFLELDQEFVHYLSPRRREDIDPSWHGLTVRELLTHSSSVPQADCEIGHDGIPNCDSMLAAERELWRCEEDEDGHPCCPRVYTNSNYQLLRILLEDLLSVHSNEDIAEYTSLDWLEAIGIEGAGCTPGPGDRYYRRSGENTLEPVAPVEGGGCGQSGWHLSTRDLARIARALRYEWVLSPESSAELFSCAQNGLLAWDTGWAGLASRAKAGRLTGTTFSTQSVIARLPTDIDVVIVTNSVEYPSPSDLVRGLWFAN